MASKETVGKKEREKKKSKIKQQKAEKRADKKLNNDKGKSLEDMMAYIDEDGNLSSTPPDPRKRKEINHEDIVLGAAPVDNTPQEIERNGVVTFFNETKGYGFINDLKSQQSVFVHINQLSGPLKERDKVTFEIEMSAKGPTAINVKKTN